jgi:hypothetical protein
MKTLIMNSQLSQNVFILLQVLSEFPDDTFYCVTATPYRIHLQGKGNPALFKICNLLEFEEHRKAHFYEFHFKNIEIIWSDYVSKNMEIGFDPD